MSPDELPRRTQCRHTHKRDPNKVGIAPSGRAILGGKTRGSNMLPSSCIHRYGEGQYSDQSRNRNTRKLQTQLAAELAADVTASDLYQCSSNGTNETSSSHPFEVRAFATVDCGQQSRVGSGGTENPTDCRLRSRCGGPNTTDGGSSGGRGLNEP